MTKVEESDIYIKLSYTLEAVLRLNSRVSFIPNKIPCIQNYFVIACANKDCRKYGMYIKMSAPKGTDI